MGLRWSRAVSAHRLSPSVSLVDWCPGRPRRTPVCTGALPADCPGGSGSGQDRCASESSNGPFPSGRWIARRHSVSVALVMSISRTAVWFPATSGGVRRVLAPVVGSVVGSHQCREETCEPRTHKRHVAVRPRAASIAGLAFRRLQIADGEEELSPPVRGNRGRVLVIRPVRPVRGVVHERIERLDAGNRR